MHVVLQVRSGVGAGRQVSLLENQTIQVGGTEWADFVVGGDPLLAAVHFRLATDHSCCRIRNLSAEAGTVVNGEPVTERVLEDGDVIVAGNTQFAVRLEDLPRSGQVSMPDAKQETRRMQALSGLPHERRFVADGLEVLYGPSVQSPLQLVERIGAVYPAWLVADFARAGGPLPDAVKQVPDLLNQFPTQLRRGRSLRCLPLAHNLSYLETLWGKDSVICVFSKAAEERLLRVLWASLGAFLRPAFLRQQLVQPGRLSRLLDSIEGVLVETRDPPGWELFKNPAAVAGWRDFGISEGGDRVRGPALP